MKKLNIKRALFGYSRVGVYNYILAMKEECYQEVKKARTEKDEATRNYLEQISQLKTEYAETSAELQAEIRRLTDECVNLQSKCDLVTQALAEAQVYANELRQIAQENLIRAADQRAEAERQAAQRKQPAAAQEDQAEGTGLGKSVWKLLQRASQRLAAILNSVDQRLDSSRADKAEPAAEEPVQPAAEEPAAPEPEPTPAVATSLPENSDTATGDGQSNQWLTFHP